MVRMGPQRNKWQVQAGTAATVSVLAGASVGPAQPATVTAFEKNVLRLSADADLPAGAVVRVKAGDALLLGEVMHCGGNAAAVRVDQVIPSMPDLLNLVRAVMGEPSSADARATTPERVRAASV
jgi:hypothetical protein